MSNKIVIKNISQPILDKEILMLNSNQVDIQSGKIKGKTLLVNGNLSIDKAAIIKFDAVCINQIGNSGVVNRGELSARGGGGYANMERDIINESGAKFNIGDQGNDMDKSHKLSKSVSKVNAVKFNQFFF